MKPAPPPKERRQDNSSADQEDRGHKVHIKAAIRFAQKSPPIHPGDQQRTSSWRPAQTEGKSRTKP